MNSDKSDIYSEVRLLGSRSSEALRWNGSQGIYVNSDNSDTPGNKEREKEGDRGIWSQEQRQTYKKSRSSRTSLFITYKPCCEQGFQLRHGGVGVVDMGRT